MVKIILLHTTALARKGSGTTGRWLDHLLPCTYALLCAICVRFVCDKYWHPFGGPAGSPRPIGDPLEGRRSHPEKRQVDDDDDAQNGKNLGPLSKDYVLFYFYRSAHTRTQTWSRQGLASFWSSSREDCAALRRCVVCLVIRRGGGGDLNKGFICNDERSTLPRSRQVRVGLDYFLVRDSRRRRRGHSARVARF